MENGCSVIALTGSPKAGKSTIFNGLTGKCRYTGGWWGDDGTPGRGTYRYCDTTYLLMDLPGIYSLPREAFPAPYRKQTPVPLFPVRPDVIAVVADATRLEMGLHLLKQVVKRAAQEETNTPIVLCVNFCDEALRQGILIDFNLLEDVLQIPVIPCCARKQRHLDDIKTAIHYAAKPSNSQMFSYDCLDFSPKNLTRECITVISAASGARRVIADHLLTSPVLGKVILLLALAAVLRLTMAASGLPSRILWDALARLENRLDMIMTYLGTAPWVTGSLIHGGFRAMSWAVAVMFPPLTVFFFCFTLLEDLGFLPRAACVMDPVLEKCSSCGGHCLSMALGLGCNAAGVACCRAIRSPRERMAAVLTSSMVPCCGRLPIFIALIPLFFASAPVDSVAGSLACALFFAILLLSAVYMALGISWLLSRTALKGLPSAFVLEMPPYRKPRITASALRSLLNRTLVMVARAVKASVPAGILIWFLANVIYTGSDGFALAFASQGVNGPSLLSFFTGVLDPAARLLGMDGIILAAFILGFPASELVLPLLIMIYMQGDSLVSMTSGLPLHQLLTSNGWTWTTAMCTLVFALFHWPCLTTCKAIAREARGWKWAAAAVCISTRPGSALCMGISFLTHLLAGF